MNKIPFITKQWKMIVLLAITLPFSFNCITTPSSPVLPKWTTQLTVQLIKRTYFFSDMISKDSSKFSTINGELVYKPAALENQPTAITLPAMSPFASSFVKALGLIPINSVTVPPVSFGSQLNGLPLAKQIDTTVSMIIGDTTLYDYLVYEDGRMTMTVANGMNINWTVVGPIVVMNSNINGDSINTLGQFTIGLVPPNGGSKTDFFAITKPQNGYLKMKFRIQSEAPVSPLPPFKTITGGNLAFNFSITSAAGGNPSLSEAKMRLLNEYVIPVSSIKDSAQKLDNRDLVAPIDSTTFIKSATFKEGSFDINIINGIPFDVVIGFNLREFVNIKTNGSFKLLDKIKGTREDSITIKGRASYNDPVEMKDYRLQARKVDPNAPNRDDTLTSEIHFSLNIKTLVRSTTKVLIKKTDSVLVEIKPKVVPYKLDVVRGKIPPTIVAIDNTVDAGIGSSTDNFSADSVKFDGAKITLNIFSKSLFPTDLKFTVKGYSDGVVSDSLSTPKGTGKNASPDNRSYRIFPGDTAKIVFDKFNPDANGKTIDQFLSRFTKNGKFKFPDKLAVTGSAILEPLDMYNKAVTTSDSSSVGIVKDNDSMYTSMEFLFPLKIGIVNGIFLADTASIGENADTSMTSSIVEGAVGFNLASTFPVALDIYSNLIKADPADPKKPSTNTATNSVLKIPQDSTKLPIGVPGALDNQVKVEYREIVLTGDDAKKIADARFNAVQIKMRTAADNGNTPLAFVKNDSIQVITVARLKFKVDNDKFK